VVATASLLEHIELADESGALDLMPREPAARAVLMGHLRRRAQLIKDLVDRAAGVEAKAEGDADLWSLHLCRRLRFDHLATLRTFADGKVVNDVPFLGHLSAKERRERQGASHTSRQRRSAPRARPA
jgi:hypothetical protein